MKLLAFILVGLYLVYIFLSTTREIKKMVDEPQQKEWRSQNSTESLYQRTVRKQEEDKARYREHCINEMRRYLILEKGGYTSREEAQADAIRACDL